MATTLTVTEIARKLGPVSLSVTEETVTINFSNNLTAFLLIADVAWLFDTTASQTNSVPIAAGQGLTLRSSSAQSYVFYARVASSTGKLYCIPLE